MNKKVLKTLEYDIIIERLASYAASCIGRSIVQKTVPQNQFETVKSSLNLTAEAETLVFKTGGSPIYDFPDVRQSLKRIHAALYFSAKELLDIARCLKAVRTCKEAIESNCESGQLKNMAESILSHRSIEEEIYRCIISEDEIFDGASPALMRIRREMRITGEKVRDKLNAMIRSQTYQKYLQEPLITIRSGRFVLPVKQECRQFIPGLIHDQSGSGATLFIEPMAIVELGNEYKKLTAEEAEEIERILTELTSLVAPYATDIITDMETVGRMDVVFAKALLAKDMDAVMPKLNNDGRIKILKGRHPLIDADCVVPIDVWVGEEFNTLIITGPNTGGKTVTLKTAGLFTLMAQSGMFVPAVEGTELAVFDEVYADIGDEQSIEQSLSTFSSHIKNIVDILKYANKNSLVLLDELGAGTDPREGAALAMSILERLHSFNCRTLATTHYSEVKAFALTRNGMENACMEFDVDKLCPTYKLFIGIPGKSNAFEISKRLGIENSVIEKAKTFLNGDDVRFEDVMNNAMSQRLIAEKEREKAESKRAELEKLRAKADEERKKIEEEKKRIINKAREEAKTLIENTRREMEQLISNLKKAPNADRSTTDRVIQQSRDAVRNSQAALQENEKKQKADGLKIPKSVQIGDTVLVASVDKSATVITLPNQKGEFTVQAGIIKMTVKLKDVRVLPQKAEKNVVSYDKAKAYSEPVRTSGVGLELDIRGMMVDEACPVIENYLSNALLQGLSEVNIIHGKGTGALRDGVQRYLKGHKLVKNFRIGNYGEGDAGVTVVTLKK